MGAENYTLGKGILYFDRYNPDTGTYSGWRDLGNAPSFSFTVTIEKLEHFSSRGGLRVKDKEIISQLTPSCSFTLDEITAENFGILGLAKVDDMTQAAETGVEDTITADQIKKNEKLFLKRHHIVYETNGTNNPKVYVSSSTGTALTEGVDFIMTAEDAKAGQITIVDTSADVAAALTAGNSLVVVYDCAASTMKKIKLFSETQILGRLRFVSDNPTGTQCTFLAKNVSLTPSGDTAFIGDDWSTLSFSAECLKSTDPADVGSPYIDIIME